MLGVVLWSLFHVALCVALIGIVLLQRDAQSKSAKAGGVVPRGGADIVTYITGLLAALFFGEVMISAVYTDRASKSSQYNSAR
jgi:preprotein translocase subunit SecG